MCSTTKLRWCFIMQTVLCRDGNCKTKFYYMKKLKKKKKKDKPTTQIVTQLNVLFIKCCNEFKFICCGLWRKCHQVVVYFMYKYKYVCYIKYNRSMIFLSKIISDIRSHDIEFWFCLVPLKCSYIYKKYTYWY